MTDQIADTVFSAESKDALRYLGKNSWRCFWLAGGAIDPKQKRAHASYAVSELFIDAGAIIGIWGSAIEVIPGIEEFVIVAQFEHEIGTAESEMRWRPKRSEVKQFPEDMDLSRFIGNVPAVRGIRSSDLREAKIQAVPTPTDCGLEFSVAGSKLFVVADVVQPLDLVVTFDSEYAKSLVHEQMHFFEI